MGPDVELVWMSVSVLLRWIVSARSNYPLALPQLRSAISDIMIAVRRAMQPIHIARNEILGIYLRVAPSALIQVLSFQVKGDRFP